MPLLRSATLLALSLPCHRCSHSNDSSTVKSSGRGVTVDVDGRIVMGIVGDVSSHSDGGGGDIYADARGRTRVRLRRCRSDSDGCQDCGRRWDRRSAPPTSIPTSASSMLEKGKRNKNGTKDIGIQAFDAILQLGVGCRLIA